MDDNQNQELENLNQPTELNDNNVADPKQQDLPKHLRSLYENTKKELDKTKAELEAIRKAEEDKQKTIEEKKAELELKYQELENKVKSQNFLHSLEKKLLTENINPEFSDLIMSKAEKLIDINSNNIDEVVSEIKTNYPSAFLAKELKPEPIGKVGVSATTSNNSFKMTKEQVTAIFYDPTKPLTKEINDLAKEYGI